MLPGFSASSSLYRSRQAYRSSGASSTLDFAQMSGVDAPVYFAFIWPTSGVTCNSPCRIEEGQCICPPRCPTGSILNKFSNECECTPCASNQRQAGSATSKAGCFCAPCPSGQIGCNTECVDSTSDPYNCGGCGNMCPKGAPCSQGVCVCPSGQVFSNGFCCPQGYWANSARGCCPIPQTNCWPVGCTDMSTDNNNCGSCGNVCRGGETCVGGKCTSPCDACINCSYELVPIEQSTQPPTVFWVEGCVCDNYVCGLGIGGSGSTNCCDCGKPNC
jgi:hypothetical protein